jgi:hypothetical protein
MRKLGVALLACLAVIAINPNGFTLYAYPIETLRLRSLQQISEWRSPDFHHAPFLIFFSLVGAAVFSVLFSRRKARAQDFLLLIGTAVAGCHSIRHIPIFVLVAIPLLSRRVDEWLADRSWAKAFFVAGGDASVTSRALNVAILLSALTFCGLHVYRTVGQLDSREAKNFPSAAVSFLATHQVPMPLFNHYDWGGYLIWRLYPKYRVWADGRTDLYGDAFLGDFLRVYWAQDGWQQRLEDWGIQSVMVPPNAPLAHALVASARWHEIYKDRQAVIFIKEPSSMS